MGGLHDSKDLAGTRQGQVLGGGIILLPINTADLENSAWG